MGRKVQHPDDPKFVIRDLDRYFNEVVGLSVVDYFEGTEGVRFLDRGLPDTMIVFPMHGGTVPGVFYKMCEELRYNDNVFLLEMLPKIDPNKHPFTYEQSLQMENELDVLYRKLGYNIIRIPVDSIEGRAKMILEAVNEKNIGRLLGKQE